MHSHMLGFVGRHQDSIAEAERSLAIDPDSFFAHWNLMRGLAWAGEYQRAIDMSPTILVESGRNTWVLGTLAWAYGRVGSPEKAGAVFDEMEGRSRHEFVSTFWLAAAASAARRDDRAAELAVHAVEVRDPLVLWSRATPFWDRLRADRRFESIVRTLSLRFSGTATATP